MTQLINLESYLECCQYAYLFGGDPQRLTPRQNELPLVYRDFCKKYLTQSFLPTPTIVESQPQELGPRLEELPIKTIGLKLEGQSSEPLFIVREANSLNLRSLDARYIYANVYYYWSYADQLQQLVSSGKKLVIYNLDGFTPAQITPLTFEDHPQSPYPIPIVDTRSLKDYDTLKLSKSYEDIYNLIIEKISQKVINDLGLTFQDALIVVGQYLKKINLFQIFEFNRSDITPLALEINDRFYLYDLSKKDLEEIVYDVINHLILKELHDIVKNQNYTFVLLSGYTKLSGLRESLQKEFQNTLLILDTDCNSFSHIWQQKLERSFPLFGQHLDRISFFVKKKDSGKEPIPLNLPEKVCYEGDQEQIVYGEYEKEGRKEQRFNISGVKKVTLPFSINSDPYINSEGIEQIYEIENQYFDETPDLEIKICFRLKPGLGHKLEVIDNHGRVLNSRLIDRVDLPASLGYISMDKIMESRRKKSESNLEKLLSSDFSTDFQIFIQFIHSTITSPPIEIKNIPDKIYVFLSKYRSKIDPILIVPSNNTINLFDRTTGHVLKDALEELINYPTKSPKIKQKMNEAHRDFLLILGNIYALTSSINLDFLFDYNDLSKGKAKNRVDQVWVERVRTIARISCSKQRQNLYFDLFYKHTDYRNKKFYKTSEYIWGYARLLLWYVDVNVYDSSSTFPYSQHFLSIVNECLKLNPTSNNQYVQDALIALIYLLTFREINPKFIDKDSDSYQKAKQLCKKLESYPPIRSRKAGIEDMSLYFEKLLDESATSEQISQMIEID